MNKPKPRHFRCTLSAGESLIGQASAVLDRAAQYEDHSEITIQLKSDDLDEAWEEAFLSEEPVSLVVKDKEIRGFIASLIIKTGIQPQSGLSDGSGFRPLPGG